MNRFVCPASKLAELGDEPLRLSVVIDTRELPAADERIEAIEAAGLDPEVLFDAAPEVYFELPLRDDVSFRILQIGELGLRAKVRCGGSVLPSVPALAEFVQACRRLEVPFKATAGLHHPVRSGDDHGFLNLLAAAVFGDEEEGAGRGRPVRVRSRRGRLRLARAPRGPGRDRTSVRRELFVCSAAAARRSRSTASRALGMLPV